MIAYCTEKSLKDCISVLDAGFQDTKKKDNDGDDDDMKKGPPAKVLWYLPIIPRLRLFLPMLVVQRTWHDMQMGENVMGYYDMLPIHHNGRKLTLCILSLEGIQEISDLVLQQMVLIHTVI